MKGFLYDQFRTLLGEQLEVEDGTGNKGCLIVDDVKRRQPDDDQWTSFSVFFKNKEDNYFLTQGTYLFRHESAGERSLFISPRSETEYEAAITVSKTEPHA